MNANIKTMSQDTIDRKELKVELALLEGKIKELKGTYDFIKSSFEGGLAIECMKPEALLLKVVSVLNEKINHAYIYSGNAGIKSVGQFFNYDSATITYRAKNSTIELYSEDGVADSFKNIYDDCLSVLKAHIESGRKSKARCDRYVLDILTR
jgi:hypothetical protein